jgi:3-oxoacyl-[acyl-carrier-protein] synthase II
VSESSRASTRRVVITGIGLVCAVGIGTEQVWEAIRAGKSGIRKITRFDTTNIPSKISAEVEGFDPEQFMERKEARRMARL